MCVGAGAQSSTGSDATQPPAVDTIEEVAPGNSETNNAGFRFSYPVRDNESGEMVTPQAPAPEDRAPAPVSRPAPLPEPEPMSIAGTGGAYDTRDFETVGGSTADASVDLGEGIFTRSPFRYSFAVYEGYNSNVNTQPNGGVSSMYTEIAAGIAYEFGTSRLQLSTALAGGLTFFYNNKDLDDNGLFPTVNFTLGANYAATPRLDLSLSTATSLLSQPNFAQAGSADYYQGPYILSNSRIGAKYLWLPKFATETSYNPVFWYYLQPGSNTTDFSRFEQTISQQFLFLWKPQTALVAEYRFNTRNYFYAKNYDSIGNYGLLGFDHTLNPRSTATFRGGVEQRIMQNPNASSSSDYVGPFGELNFNYSLRPETVATLLARYGTSASNLSGFNQSQQMLIGSNLAHRFGRRLAGNLFFNYQNNYYNQPNSNLSSFSNNVFNTGVNLAFQVNRVVSLQGGYTFTALSSTDTVFERDYTQSIVFLGVEMDF